MHVIAQLTGINAIPSQVRGSLDDRKRRESIKKRALWFIIFGLFAMDLLVLIRLILNHGKIF